MLGDCVHDSSIQLSENGSVSRVIRASPLPDLVVGNEELDASGAL